MHYGMHWTEALCPWIISIEYHPDGSTKKVELHSRAAPVSNPLVAGLTATGIGSHRAGCIYAEESFFLAMPRLPSYSPFVSSEHVNEEVGVSMRTAYGPLGVGSNQFKMGSDLLFGATMCQDYGMRLCFPVAS